MRVQTKASGLSLTPDVEAYLNKRLASLGKLLQGEELAILSVELSRTTKHHEKGDIYEAELTLRGPGLDHRAVARTTTLFAAIDEAKDELLGAVRSGRGKQQTIFRKSAARFKEALRRLNPF